MSRTSALICFAAASFAAAVVPASAQSVSSTYEKFNFDKCKLVEEGERDISRLCKMKKGPDLLIIWHEHGVDIKTEPAASQELYETNSASYKIARTGHFGGLFAKKGLTTLEWRVEQVNGSWQPFAAIYRTTYAEFDNSGTSKARQRLDILKVGPDHACQLATVEARIKNHNVKAREIADAARGTNPCPEVSE